MRPTLTVSLPSFGEWAGGDWSRLITLGREADEAGVHRVVVPDHVVIGPGVEDYPWGRFPRPFDAHGSGHAALGDGRGRAGSG